MSEPAKVKEYVAGHAMELIVILLLIVVFFILINNASGGRVVRGIVCGLIFLMPFGGMFSALTQGCAAIAA